MNVGQVNIVNMQHMDYIMSLFSNPLYVFLPLTDRLMIILHNLSLRKKQVSAASQCSDATDL